MKQIVAIAMLAAGSAMAAPVEIGYMYMGGPANITRPIAIIEAETPYSPGHPWNQGPTFDWLISWGGKPGSERTLGSVDATISGNTAYFNVGFNPFALTQPGVQSFGVVRGHLSSTVFVRNGVTYWANQTTIFVMIAPLLPGTAQAIYVDAIPAPTGSTSVYNNCETSSTDPDIYSCNPTLGSVYVRDGSATVNGLGALGPKTVGPSDYKRGELQDIVKYNTDFEKFWEWVPVGPYECCYARKDN